MWPKPWEAFLGQNFVKLFEGYHNREKSDSNNNPSDENKAKEMHLTTHYWFFCWETGLNESNSFAFIIDGKLPTVTVA